MSRTGADLTIFVFGLMAIIAGLIGLVSPELMLRLMNVPILDRTLRQQGDYTIVLLLASSVASLNMGIYYLLAAWNQWREFYKFTVVFRLVTVVVFFLAVINDHAPNGSIGIAVWELLGAFVTGITLWYDSNRRKNIIKQK